MARSTEALSRPCRPHLTIQLPRLGLLVWLLTLAALCPGCGGGASAAVPAGGPGTLSASSPGEQAWAERVLELTNLERAAHGLDPLQFDEQAALVAYEHAWDMHVRGYFAHLNPDGEGPEDRMRRHEVEFVHARENLARGHATPEEVVRGWMESPSHRVNILYPGWTHVGIAVHSGSSDGPWWAQEFFHR